jgi:hypothetical protein
LDYKSIVSRLVEAYDAAESGGQDWIGERCAGQCQFKESSMLNIRTLLRGAAAAAVTILIAFAGADVQEHAWRIHVPDLEMQSFAQAQPTRVDRAQANAVIQGFDLGQDLAHFLGGEDDRQLELRIGPDQLDFSGPVLARYE